ncbi:MAG: DUF1800 domain-containing protein [Acidobacteria bacterium]|nr:DUF1800 domain-containing protein [Acidobacteriota bacterium]
MKRNNSLIHQLTALALVAALAAPLFAFGADTKGNKVKSLTEDQKILHVLNRLGFGARPGDIEKVKALGIKAYIDKQLDAAAIPDSIADSKVKGIEVFNMSTAEIFAKYPNPGALLRMLDGNQANQNNAEEMNEQQRRERQQKLRDYYVKYDLKPAAQLVPQISANRVLRAVYSERQLQEVMVDFWQNHFNVFAGKAAVRWYIPSYERDVIRKNALGNFKDLVVGTAQHPAMLFYLDNFENVSPTANVNQRGGLTERQQTMLRNGNLTPQMRQRIKQRTGATDAEIDARIKQMRDNPNQQMPQQQRRGLNENYARELMELHTLGVDGGYTQQDIIEVAKAFTGWTIADPRGYRSAAANEIKGQENRRLERLQRMAGVPDDLESGEFYFNDRLHEKGAKNVLGQKIDNGGIKDGLKVIDILVSHPSTARFIARKLAVKFVSDKPDEQLVTRVAKAFQDSNGDIKTTLKALFNDREFFAAENYRAKIKTPFELAISAIRTIGAETNGSPAVVAMLQKLGEVPYGYQAPTGYPDTAEDWVNTGALLERLNFSVALASNRIPGTRVDLKRFESVSKTTILEKTLETVLDSDVSASTKQTLMKQIEQPLPDVKAPNEIDEELELSNMRGQGQGNRNRQTRLLPPSGNPEVFKIVSLVLGTPEFQRQ